MMSLDQMMRGIEHLPLETMRIMGEDRELARWSIHDCSMCGYRCGYIINLKPRPGEATVLYDAGCRCGAGFNITPRTFEDMYSHYSMQSNEEVKRRMEAEFGI